MTVEELDEKIADAERRLDSLKPQCEAVAERWTDAAARWAKTWFEHQAERAIKDKPARAQELGTEGLGTLKRALADLKAALPAEARRRLLEDDSLWAHR